MSQKWKKRHSGKDLRAEAVTNGILTLKLIRFVSRGIEIFRCRCWWRSIFSSGLISLSLTAAVATRQDYWPGIPQGSFKMAHFQPWNMTPKCKDKMTELIDTIHRRKSRMIKEVRSWPFDAGKGISECGRKWIKKAAASTRRERRDHLGGKRVVWEWHLCACKQPFKDPLNSRCCSSVVSLYRRSNWSCFLFPIRRTWARALKILWRRQSRRISRPAKM